MNSKQDLPKKRKNGSSRNLPRMLNMTELNMTKICMRDMNLRRNTEDMKEIMTGSMTNSSVVTTMIMMTSGTGTMNGIVNKLNPNSEKLRNNLSIMNLEANPKLKKSNQKNSVLLNTVIWMKEENSVKENPKPKLNNLTSIEAEEVKMELSNMRTTERDSSVEWVMRVSATVFKTLLLNPTSPRITGIISLMSSLDLS